MFSCRPARAAFIAALITVAAPRVCAAQGAWIINAGGQLDDEDGYRVDAGAAWFPNEAASVTALLGRADSSTDFDEFASTVASLAFDYNFDPIGVSIDARWRSDSEFLEAITWGGSLYFKRGPWRLSFRGESRGTDFEPQSFTGVLIRDRGAPVTVSATSECSLDNIAYGATASYGGSVWSASLFGTQFDYSDAECELTDVRPPGFGRFLRTHPELLPLIAPRLALFQGVQRSSVTRESTFLDWTAGLAVSAKSGERTWGVDYFHDREQFQQLESDTLIGSVVLPLADRFDIELSAGATDTDLIGTVGFAGLMLYAYFGSL
jgi:hypothetical protein